MTLHSSRQLAVAALAGIVITGLTATASAAGADSSRAHQHRGAHSMELVSRAVGDTPANGDSRGPVVSANARYIAYWSLADNLVAGDDNNNPDVFRYDTNTGNTIAVSHGSDGTTANGESGYPSISGTGRYIAYMSGADDLPGPHQPGTADIYRYDAVTDTNLLVSRPSNRRHYFGSVAPSISGNGRWIAYWTTDGTLVPHDTNFASDVFLFDAVTHKTIRISLTGAGRQRPGDSTDPAISANGTFVVYTYRLGPASRNHRSVYRYSVATGKTILVSRSTAGVRDDKGSDQPTISADGRHIAYRSAATNLVRGDTGGHADIFMFDAKTKRTSMLSITPAGRPANAASAAPALSGDAQHVVWQSAATNLYAGAEGHHLNVYERYLGRGGSTVLYSESTTRRPPNGPSAAPSLSGDGFAGVFESRATNIVPPDTRRFDIFLRQYG